MSDYRENRYLPQNTEFGHLTEIVTCSKIGRSTGILLIGPPGTGKTLCAITLARDFSSQYFIIDGGNQVDRRDMEGNWEIMKEGEASKTVFTPGPIVKAINSANKNGTAFLIINEINGIRESEQISLNSLLSESHINLISDAGRRVELNGDAKLVIVGTMNRKVLGINKLQEAFDDRFSHNIIINYPTNGKEVNILEIIAGCDRKFASIVVEAAQHLRNAAMRDMTIGKIYSTRLAVNFAYMVDQMKTKFLVENIESMIVNKLAEEEEEYESIRQLLDGINFTERIRDCFVEKVEKEEPIEVEAVITTKDIVTRMERIIKNECMPNFKIFRAGKLSYQTLEYLWKNHKAATQEYFMLTDEKDLFNEYERENGKSPIYGGDLTFTYIYWLYQKRMGVLIEFMTKLYPIIKI